MTKYQNKYRIESIRLPYYELFATWCIFHYNLHTQQNTLFREITNGKMQLNEFGKIVEEEWLKTPMIRPDMNLILDEYIIMPIIFIRSSLSMKMKLTPVEAQCIVPLQIASLQQIVSLQINLDVNQKISVQCRGFNLPAPNKSTSCDPPQSHQSGNAIIRHIIRNEKSLSEIRNYIQNNINWEHDEYYIHS
jgi:hypothetical protein